MENARNSRTQNVNRYLHYIVSEIGPRSVGSVNNIKVQKYIADVFRKSNFIVTEPTFSCFDWAGDKAELKIDSTDIKSSISPLSMPCEVGAKMVSVQNITELEKSSFEDRIAVLSGELTQEALMPKSFVFYNPEHHKRIIGLLEKKNPLAIITIAQSDEKVFPIFEDGDFLIPSVYVSKSEGEKIIARIDHRAELKIISERITSQGANVIAKKQGAKKKKVIVCAHYDTKHTTPGAIDNASGTVVLLCVAGLMKDRKLMNDLELVAFNGEDYYSVPGQMQYMKSTAIEDVALVINADGVGVKGRKIGVAHINVSQHDRDIFLKVQHDYKNIQEIEPWVEGDHSMFTMQGIPALAITSTDIFDMVETIIHTPEDTLDKLDQDLIEETARYIVGILEVVGG